MSQDARLIRWFLGFQNFIQSRAEFRPLAEFTAVPPGDMRNPEAMRVRHVAAALYTLYSNDFEDLAIRAIDAYARETWNAADPPTAERDAFLPHVETIKQSGYALLPPVPADTVAEMRSYFAGRPVFESLGPPDPAPVPLDRAKHSLNLAHYAEADVLNCPHLLDLALGPVPLGIARDFLGTVPVVITCAAWWSFADAPEARDAQLYHLDLDDYRFLKFFIYLTDVDAESGPHLFVPTTHRQDVLTKAREAAENPEQFDRWLGQLRKTDAEVEAAFGIQADRITGPAGTAFIANTRGIHKGLLPKNRDRLVCQIVFGVTPQRIRDTLPVHWSERETPNIDRRFVEPPFDYMTHLYLSA